MITKEAICGGIGSFVDTGRKTAQFKVEPGIHQFSTLWRLFNSRRRQTNPQMGIGAHF